MLPSRICRIPLGCQGLSILSALLLLQAANTERSANEIERSEDFRQADTATSDIVENVIPKILKSVAARSKRKRIMTQAQGKQDKTDAEQCIYLLNNFDDRYMNSKYKRALVEALRKPACQPVFEEWGLDPKANYEKSWSDILTKGSTDDHLNDGGLMAMWELLLRKQDKEETENPAKIERADLEERKNFFPWAGDQAQDVTYDEQNKASVVPGQDWSSVDKDLDYERVKNFASERIQPIKDWALNVRNLEAKADAVVATASAADNLGTEEAAVLGKIQAKRQVALKKARDEKLSELIALNRAVTNQKSPNFKELEKQVSAKMKGATSGFAIQEGDDTVQGGSKTDVASAAKRNDDRVIANMKWIKQLNDDRFVSRLKPSDE